MSKILEIDGKTLLPIKEVLEKVSYTRDYITRLAREKKIDAVNVGRQWFVNVESLERYTKMVETEKELRKQQLSLERKQEKEILTSLSATKQRSRDRVKTIHVKSATLASLVLGVSLIGGGAFYYSFYNKNFGLGLGDLAAVSSSQADVNNLEEDYSGYVDEKGEEVRQLGNLKTGVVLFPEGIDEAEVELFFSDDVVVEIGEDGRQAVIKLGSDGQPYGKSIPFVEVPVSRQRNI